MKLSGWCSPAFGTCESLKAHEVCEDRIRRGLIDLCECTRGHAVGNTSGMSVVRGMINESGPESALTDRGPRPHPAKEL